MPGYNIPSPPNTSDPKKISNYLTVLVDEYLPYMFNNIDEENLSENILNAIQNLTKKVEELQNSLDAVIGKS